MSDWFSKIVSASESGQTSVDLDGQVVILGLESNVYYRLDDVGARIWELLQKPRSVESILQTILQEYSVHEEEAQDDLLNLLDELAREHLIDARQKSISADGNEQRQTG